jgi:hypothetical protein
VESFLAKVAAWNKALIFFVVIGFLAAAIISWQRHWVEDVNKNVEIVMTYEAIADMAHSEGVLAEDLFRRFKEAGVTSLAVAETSLEKLEKEGQVTVLPGRVILEQKKAGAVNSFWQGFQEPVEAKDVYVVVEDDEIAGEVKTDLEHRLSQDRVRVTEYSGQMVLVLKADYEKVREWNLGLPAKQLQEAVAAGFYVVARPSNYTAVTKEDIDAVFERLAVIEKDKVSAIVFTAAEALGYPGLLKETAAHLQENQFNLGLIEHAVQLQFLNQEGLLPLTALNNYNAVRLYTIHKGEQIKLDIDEASRRFANSARERNLRLHLVHPFEKTIPGKTLIETNLSYVAQTKADLASKGFAFGKVAPFQPYFPAPVLVAAVVLGIVCGATLLLANIFPVPLKWQYAIAFLGAAILIFPILKGAGNLARQIAALGGICCLPVLAVTYQVDYWQKLCAQKLSPAKVFVLGSLGLVAATLASLAGGIYASAVLSDIRYFLEIEIFRGVKISLILPLILISLVYLARFYEQDKDKTSLKQEIDRLLNYPVLVKTLLFAGIALIVVYVFLGRSGHTAGIPVPGIELKMRLFLEETLYARPRGKEFLIGHPAFMLLLGALAVKLPRLWRYLLLVAATIGQSSVAQTFAHMRTPVFMSVMRGLEGLVLGLVLGALALFLFYVCLKFIAKKESGAT